MLTEVERKILREGKLAVKAQRKLANVRYRNRKAQLKNMHGEDVYQLECNAFADWHRAYWDVTAQITEKYKLEAQKARENGKKEVREKADRSEKEQYLREPAEKIDASADLDSPEGSRFTGGAIMNALIALVTVFVSVISLGFAYPAMRCWKERWIAERTYIDGKQLVFDGKAGQLFGKYIVWVLLSVITLGIYLILKSSLLMQEWICKHTHFKEETPAKSTENDSRFTGKWYQLFGVKFLTFFVNLITLRIGSYWAHCYKERWFAKHKIIDGNKLYFNGTGLQYFCKRIIWVLLSLITLGIYLFWLSVKSKKWTVKHTHIRNV